MKKKVIKVSFSLHISIVHIKMDFVSKFSWKIKEREILCIVYPQVKEVHVESSINLYEISYSN